MEMETIEENKKTQLLRMLRCANGHVSGQRICEAFGVSRTAVWKMIRQLEEEGYRVEAVRNKGYRILESPDVLTAEEIGSLIDTAWMGHHLICYETTDSTNLRLKQLGDDGAPDGTLAVADRQTAGRGRRGRSWESKAGESIAMSILLRPGIHPNKAPMLTLVMAVSVAEAIRDCANDGEADGLAIKWPNDIIIGGKKLLGILTEMSTQIDYISHVVVGVGINVNMTEFPAEVQETATSLKLAWGRNVRRAPLTAAVVNRFEKNYEIFLKTEDLSGILETYSALLINKDRDVWVLDAKGKYKAHALGITKTGELVVRREDGSTEEIYAGEVSVRGVYGYV